MSHDKSRPELPYGDPDNVRKFKEAAECAPEVFVVWNGKSGRIIRVVECAPVMLTMSGSWSSSYRSATWEDMRSVYEAYASGQLVKKSEDK